MKKKFLALSVAALVGGFATGASASVLEGSGPSPSATGTAGMMAERTSTDLVLNAGGIGHILMVPYYTAQGDNATLLNITNTDTYNGKAVKVRFRGAQNSDDVFDFQVYLSPGDIWTARVSKGADGRARLDTADNSCTLPASINQSFVTDRLPGTEAEKAGGTLEGYVEIFNMADVPPTHKKTGDANPVVNPLYTAIKHVNGTAPCTSAVLGLLKNDITAEDDAVAKGFDTPTSGLMANWIIINVPEATSWAGEATAVQATGGNGHGNFVFYPQMGTAHNPTAEETADPLLLGQLIKGAFYDLPDLSTPYASNPTVIGSANIQAAALTESIATTSIINEFVTDPGMLGATDWLFSMPTRRYSVAVDYAATGSARLVFNNGVFVGTTGAYNAANYGTGAFFSPGQTGTRALDGSTVPLGVFAVSSGNVTLDGITACVKTDSPAFTDRSERTGTTDFVISPGTPKEVALCGETNVLSFNGSSALGAKIAHKNADVEYIDGWAVIGTPSGGTTNAGLPVVGQAFLKAVNPAVSAGTSGNFGANWNHRTTK